MILFLDLLEKHSSEVQNEEQGESNKNKDHEVEQRGSHKFTKLKIFRTVILPKHVEFDVIDL